MNKSIEFAKKKSKDLKLMLKKCRAGEIDLHYNDIIRYEAMIEVLDQVVKIGKSTRS